MESAETWSEVLNICLRGNSVKHRAAIEHYRKIANFYLFITIHVMNNITIRDRLFLQRRTTC